MILLTPAWGYTVTRAQWRVAFVELIDDKHDQERPRLISRSARKVD